MNLEDKDIHSAVARLSERLQVAPPALKIFRQIERENAEQVREYLGEHELKRFDEDIDYFLGLGEYWPPTNTIVLFPDAFEDNQPLKTVLHEFAHHLQYLQTRTLGHGDDFYSCLTEVAEAWFDTKAEAEEFMVTEKQEVREFIQKRVHTLVKNTEKKYPHYVLDEPAILTEVLHNLYTIWEIWGDSAEINRYKDNDQR